MVYGLDVDVLNFYVVKFYERRKDLIAQSLPLYFGVDWRGTRPTFKTSNTMVSSQHNHSTEAFPLVLQQQIHCIATANM